MEATQRAPIRQNDLQQGEVYDARLEGKLSGWHGVKTQPNTLPINGMNTVPIREQEAFAGKLLHTPATRRNYWSLPTTASTKLHGKLALAMPAIFPPGLQKPPGKALCNTAKAR